MHPAQLVGIALASFADSLLTRARRAARSVATKAEWDMKVYLAEDYGYESGLFYLHDEQGRVVRSDVFGNVMYGSMLAHWDVDPETALAGANLGDKGGVDAGKGDDPLDDEAVKFGYDLHSKYPNGLTEKQFYEEIANAHLTD
ncbi:polymorphic toxin type 44 domain-containing protein [Leifsonia sp. Leaf336]|uniref:polymorphic toxin type 44 domain-containing protein n=1 Tax=Leifsonia sp. Leaf336 TaxID=1736341 RepID=UPI0009EA1DBB|nr:polymorphic toxin type 44 domain-containing protein [Leifsonia sp. Leaf336]